MRNYTTISDNNYLVNGLALYDSIKHNSDSEFKLYYLCMDDFTYEKVSSINEDSIIPINIKELEDDSDFHLLKSNTNYIPNSSECTYCFALGSFFTYYIVKKFTLDEVMYVDSDILFYENPEIIFSGIQNKSIGIVLHRHVSIGHHVGGYNVGVVYFKINEVGYKCLKWWRDCVMNPNNEWFQQYGRVADQVYLEGFEPLFGVENVAVIDNWVGHGAPWNMNLYQYLENNYINWSGRIQKMVFIHFSHFSPDYKNDRYREDREGEWGSLNLGRPEIKKYYQDYFNKLKISKNKYSI